MLRIEDTDKTRSEKRYEKGILDGLKWLGISWDNKKIIRQSERIPLYKKYLERLLIKNAAYYCFCSAEELDLERQAQLSQGLQPKYSGKCKHLLTEEVNKNLAESKPAVIRFKTPVKEGWFHDIVRGKVPYNGNLIGDIIIAKGLEEPLYNFAVVIDDEEMGITHVIRGEDHLSNTPKQIFLIEALGFGMPEYAHLPLILGPDRKKLSKRFLDASLDDYIRAGYLKDAMINFLALLGWHPKEDREVISIPDMIKEFTLSRVQKSGAVFNPEKLDWLNSLYIKEMGNSKLLSLLKPFIPVSWQKQKKLLLNVLEVEKPRLKKLSEFEELAKFFFVPENYSSELLIWKNTTKDATKSNLEATLKILENLKKPEDAEEAIARLANERGRGEVFWPLRAALSGRNASPGPIEIINIVGVSEASARVQSAIEKL